MSGEAKYPEDIDQELISLVPRSTVVNATEIAADCGSPRVANIVLVGVLSRVMDLEPALVEQAIREMLPERVLDINLKAFHRGRELYDAL